MATQTVHVANLASYTPTETIELVSRMGASRGRMRPDKIFFSAISSGCLLCFASAASLIATASPWLQENAPGIVRIISGLVFPSGIVMIISRGDSQAIRGRTITGTNMITAVAAYHRRLPIQKMLLHWFLCFWGNLAGSLFVMAVILGYGGVFDHSPYRDQAISNAKQKQVDLKFRQIFLRALGCNWLVCLACYLGLQAKGLTPKVVGMWWPVFVFVTLVLEHVVANMFFIPIALFLGTPDLTVGLYIWKGIIPTALGNVMGGAGFCGAFYYWLYIFDEPDICVDGAYYQRLDEDTLFGSRSPTVAVEADGGKDGSSSGDLAGNNNNTKAE
ncbi:Formate/nitrite transporter-domain-containing protein [Parachaetomium inaequale]|uniref:Formate/nitrite transporter-domain-containing protein n=1 Tax=Parachaetomium inaequale TaxID=2588326 RepID=A0AAN6SV95_9PEZI|nr:Formate/nitrite transporter-domain-containing protein [Parachaetomium inaequale]